MTPNRLSSESVTPEGHPRSFSNNFARPGGSSPTLGPASIPSDQRRGDLSLHSWQWPTLEPGPSNQAYAEFTTVPTVLKPARLRSQPRASHPLSQSMTEDSPPVGCNPDYMGHHIGQRLSTQTCDLPPLCYPHRWELGHPCSLPPKESEVPGGNSLCSGPEKGELNSEDDDTLSPLDHWRHKTLLASPFSEDSDSDDGLAPSPFSSPESSNASDDVEDDQRSPSLYFSSTSLSEAPRYQHLDEYPSRPLYHDSPEDEHSELPPLSLSLSPLSFSSTSPTTLLAPEPTFEAGSSSSSGPPDLWSEPPLSPLDDSPSFELGLQSPSLRSSSLPLFDSFPYPYHDMSTPIPDSPHHHSTELPSLDNEPHLHSESLGLSSSSNHSPFSSLSFDNHEFAVPSGYPQRTTWLSLPGADTDDDLIPADLASKNYIPDPDLALPTTSPSRSLLIWDPNTRSGLPPGIPTFDGTGRPLSHRFLVNEAPSARLPSADESFEVDPSVVAELAKKDAEKGQEAQKICELRQRTTMAAVAAAAMAANKCGNREGAQWEAERVKERWRELTALLRLKLKSEGKSNADSQSLVGSDKADDGLPQPKALTGSNRSSSLPTSTLASITESAENGRDSSPSSASPASSPPQTQAQRRSSKPKITSMAQLVANMVFHRQQEALRRSPSRGRTWPPPSLAPQTSGVGSKKLLTHATPKSPLRQMILPDDDVEGGSEDVVTETDSPLQLSPLCLAMCQSPESLYGCLDVEPTTSLAGHEG